MLQEKAQPTMTIIMKVSADIENDSGESESEYSDDSYDDQTGHRKNKTTNP